MESSNCLVKKLLDVLLYVVLHFALGKKRKKMLWICSRCSQKNVKIKIRSFLGLRCLHICQMCNWETTSKCIMKHNLSNCSPPKINSCLSPSYLCIPDNLRCIRVKTQPALIICWWKKKTCLSHRKSFLALWVLVTQEYASFI